MMIAHFIPLVSFIYLSCIKKKSKRHNQIVCRVVLYHLQLIRIDMRLKSLRKKRPAFETEGKLSNIFLF